MDRKLNLALPDHYLNPNSVSLKATPHTLYLTVEMEYGTARDLHMQLMEALGATSLKMRNPLTTADLVFHR
jgi:hypothetical protein